jgi:hypothetical protein
VGRPSWAGYGPHEFGTSTPVQFGRFIADQIPGARMLGVRGRDHAPWLVDHAGLIALFEASHGDPDRAVTLGRRLGTRAQRAVRGRPRLGP